MFHFKKRTNRNKKKHRQNKVAKINVHRSVVTTNVNRLNSSKKLYG